MNLTIIWSDPQNVNHPLSSCTAQSWLHDRTSGHWYSGGGLPTYWNSSCLLLEDPGFPSTTDELNTQLGWLLKEGGQKVATCCLFDGLPLWLRRMALALCRGTRISVSISHSWELCLCFLLCFSGIQKRSSSALVFKQGINYRSGGKVFHRKLLPISNQHNPNLFIFPHQTAQPIIFSLFSCSVFAWMQVCDLSQMSGIGLFRVVIGRMNYQNFEVILFLSFLFIFQYLKK